MNIQVTSSMLLEILQPSMPTLINPYVETEISTMWISSAEIALVQQMDREGFIRNFPPVMVTQIDRINSEIDPLYLEASRLVYLDPVSVCMRVEVAPGKWFLKKYGIETVQDAVGILSNSWMTNYANGITLTPGDLINFLGSDFEVLTSKLIDFFVNTQVSLHTLLTLKNLPS
jgi:hypothetical protein